ncbi:hypothetical protein [Yoonia sp.]|uniref:hypothetical protein n=1 Tax=Yoonia sp. TaxID=2212373 RepID=UPI00238CDC9C|nr:hypothetical protein [Yoonia sp.]MDE0851376.1 hypothetical protein [Yoonia sp.]
MTPRILTLSVITSLLVGCMASEDVTNRPEGLTPVDVIDVQTDLTAQFPDANAFSALAPSGEGVIFALDGTATYVNPAFGTQLESTISGFDENTMCVAEAGSWSGLCISLFQTQSGGYYCEGTFGDGSALNYPCTLRPAIRP